MSTDGKPRARRPDRRLNHIKKYGITQDDYRAIIKTQKGVCACCGKPPGTKGLVIDHCHTTGTVRGLLCTHCNVGIGCLGDSLTGLEQAIRYLRSVWSRTGGAILAKKTA